MGEGKERMMNGRPATFSQKRDWEKGMKQELLQKEWAFKNIKSQKTLCLT
jgi:hypothetical protein